MRRRSVMWPVVRPSRVTGSSTNQKSSTVSAGLFTGPKLSRSSSKRSKYSNGCFAVRSASSPSSSGTAYRPSRPRGETPNGSRLSFS
eukprot:scaffold255582_cov42-Prasinocladus_malaysianus.AAC.1